MNFHVQESSAETDDSDFSDRSMIVLGDKTFADCLNESHESTNNDHRESTNANGHAVEICSSPMENDSVEYNWKTDTEAETTALAVPDGAKRSRGSNTGHNLTG